MLQCGNAYHMGSHTVAWEPGKGPKLVSPLKGVNWQMKNADKRYIQTGFKEDLWLESV